jgi:hypothetical protein
MNIETAKQLIAARKVTGGRIIDDGNGFQICGGQAERASSAGYLNVVRILIADGKTYRDYAETLAKVTDAQARREIKRYKAMWA